ncbi:uncharacterized protein TrAtP1_010036 [Trichoderma atroviride]|uniref:uncharacterized protein n=1 Tax=Hypocrea atroviridis TaxID=63577 RepID=UPI00332B8914|nr:hypothetical protein TrAtP1_010036 [Trichoderma atroviride]
MERFSRKRLKEKYEKYNSKLPFFSRKKDKASGTIDDQQAQDNGSTPESSTSLNSAFPNPVNSSNAPAQTPTSSTTALSPDDEYQDMPIAELWNSAYEKLRKENKQLIDEYETKLQESASAASDPIPNTKGDREKWMSLVLRQKMEQIQKDAWKFMFLGSEVRPAETVECVLRVIKMVNDSITATVVPSPYASLAWAGINVLLYV